MIKVLLRATDGNLAKSKKLQYWTSRKAVLLLTFLAEAVFNDGEIAVGAFLKTLAENILFHEVDNTPEEMVYDEDSG